MDNETYPTQLNVHLESRKHREFASNDSNYARIDEFIIKNELEVETFKAKMYKINIMYKKISDTDHILLLRNYCDMYTGLIRQSNWLVFVFDPCKS